VQTTKSKVVILGKSHLRGNVPRSGNYLSAKSEVSGYIKPGAWLRKFVGTTDSFRLIKNDVFVLNGGVNEVCNNN
jgi:hypothetical protein